MHKCKKKKGSIMLLKIYKVKNNHRKIFKKLKIRNPRKIQKIRKLNSISGNLKKIQKIRRLSPVSKFRTIFRIRSKLAKVLPEKSLTTILILITISSDNSIKNHNKKTIG